MKNKKVIVSICVSQPHMDTAVLAPELKGTNLINENVEYVSESGFLFAHLKAICR